MEQDPEVVPKIQGSPNTPHQIVTGTHLNPEGGSIQTATSGGQDNLDTSTTGKDFRRTPIKGGYFSGSFDTSNGTGKKTAGGEGITLEVMAKVGNQGERPRHRTLGQTGKCDGVSVQISTTPGGTGIDDNGAHP